MSSSTSPSSLLLYILPIIIIYISHYYYKTKRLNNLNNLQIDQLDIVNNHSKIIEIINNQIIELKNKNENNNNRIIELENNNNSLNNRIIKLNYRIKELESINNKNNNNKNNNSNNDSDCSNSSSSSISISSSFNNNNSNYNSSNETISSLFSKVFGNKVIRNEILKHRDLYKFVATSNQQLFNHPFKEYIVELEYVGSELLKAGAVPLSVKKLTIDSAEIEIGSIPCGINEIHFGREFNSPLVPNMIPNSTKSIVFYYISKFNHQILPGTLPFGLEHLKFGAFFRHPIEPGMLPSSLITLDLGVDFDYPIEPGVLPSSLKTMAFSYRFNHPINYGTFNEGLCNITFGSLFNQDIQIGLIPSTVKKITFHNCNLDKIPSYCTIPHVNQIFLRSNLRELAIDDRLKSKIIYY